MKISFTIPEWLIFQAIPGYLALGVLMFYLGGAMYAYWGQDQKERYVDALIHQWLRVERLWICVLLWPLAIYELHDMFERRRKYKATQPYRWRR